jgi:hypothetical protein
MEPAAKAASDFAPPAPPAAADAMPALERARRVALTGTPSPPRAMGSAVLPAAQTTALYPVLRPPPTPEPVAAAAGSTPLETPPDAIVPANADAVVPANPDSVVPANPDSIVPANPDSVMPANAKSVVPANPDAWDPKTFGGRR